jgi:hypothetical protein
MRYGVCHKSWLQRRPHRAEVSLFNRHSHYTIIERKAQRCTTPAGKWSCQDRSVTTLILPLASFQIGSCKPFRFPGKQLGQRVTLHVRIGMAVSFISTVTIKHLAAQHGRTPACTKGASGALLEPTWSHLPPFGPWPHGFQNSGSLLFL